MRGEKRNSERPTPRTKATFDPGDEQWRCCAESKQRPGERCKNKAVVGRRTCRMHGGTTMGAPPTNGRYTGVFKRLRSTYETSYQDPTLLDLRESLALLDVIVHKAIERAEALDTPEFRKDAYRKWRECRKLRNKGENDLAEFRELGTMLQHGTHEDSAALSMMRAVQAQADTTIDVWKVRLARQAVINERDLSVIFMRIHDVIVDAASTPKEAAAILAELERTVLIPGGASDGQSGVGYIAAPPQHVDAEQVDAEQADT